VRLGARRTPGGLSVEIALLFQAGEGLAHRVGAELVSGDQFLLGRKASWGFSRPGGSGAGVGRVFVGGIFWEVFFMLV
jgi:hypothetical protein